MLVDTSLMNRRLAESYEKAFDRFSGFNGAKDVSAPLLLQVPDAYTQASRRLMVVGQQTDGWGEGYDPSSVGALMKGYADFNLGAGKWRRTPFWRAAHELYRTLNPACPPEGFLWSNLAKVDVAGGCPPRAILERVLQWRLLPKEIDIAKPDVVVFFTGPQYDGLLRETFPAARVEAVGDYIARVTATDNSLPPHAYRTYHPKFLSFRRHWNVLSQIADRVIGT
jgi:hypothetical protein